MNNHYGEDCDKFAGYFPRSGRFVPQIGQHFAIAEWMSYKNGIQDRSGTDLEFLCTSTHKTFCGVIVHGRLIGRLDGRPVSFPEGLSDDYTFNTNVIKLRPLEPVRAESVLGCSYQPCYLHTHTICDCHAQAQGEIARLSRQLAYANNLIASKDRAIRRLEDKAEQARRALL